MIFHQKAAFTDSVDLQDSTPQQFVTLPQYYELLQKQAQRNLLEECNRQKKLNRDAQKNQQKMQSLWYDNSLLEEEATKRDTTTALKQPPLTQSSLLTSPFSYHNSVEITKQKPLQNGPMNTPGNYATSIQSQTAGIPATTSTAHGGQPVSLTREKVSEFYDFAKMSRRRLRSIVAEEK